MPATTVPRPGAVSALLLSAKCSDTDTGMRAVLLNLDRVVFHRNAGASSERGREARPSLLVRSGSLGAGARDARFVRG
jgi:hypothetical protein